MPWHILLFLLSCYFCMGLIYVLCNYHVCLPCPAVSECHGDIKWDPEELAALCLVPTDGQTRLDYRFDYIYYCTVLYLENKDIRPDTHCHCFWWNSSQHTWCAFLGDALQHQALLLFICRLKILFPMLHVIPQFFILYMGDNAFFSSVVCVFLGTVYSAHLWCLFLLQGLFG